MVEPFVSLLAERSLFLYFSTLTWLSIFGNSALHSVIFDGNLALAQSVIANPAHGFLLTCWHSIRGFRLFAGVATITWLTVFM